MKYRFFNINLDFTTSKAMLEFLGDLKEYNSIRTLFFLNANCFNIAQKDSEYRDIINESDFLLNDGVGIDIAASLLKLKFSENLNGTDLIPEILRVATKLGYKIYFLGGEENVAIKAAEKLMKLFPPINIVGTHSGYFNKSEEALIIDDINEKSPDILVVGMGVPIQEKWIAANKDKLKSVKLCIAGGAIFDFLSGKLARAPLFIRKLRCEWLFRLLLEPKRLYKRYLIGNFVFFKHIICLSYKLENQQTVNITNMLYNIRNALSYRFTDSENKTVIADKQDMHDVSLSIAKNNSG